MVIQSKHLTTIRRYMSITALIDTLRRNKLALLNPDSWDDQNDCLFMKAYKTHKNAGGLYGLCAALRGETYHHWKIFAGGASGACLVLRRRPLEDYLEAHQSEHGTNIRYGVVRYLTLEKVRALSPDNINDLPFLKRFGFKDESEYRVVIETEMEQQPAIFIDCPHAWIKTVYLNPWIYKEQAKSLIETIKEIPGCSEIDVRPSQLTDSTTWREAANRVTGKASHTPLTLADAEAAQPKPVIKQISGDKKRYKTTRSTRGKR